MAEQEIAKHTKKVYKIWTGAGHSWKNKLKEFIIEILIIVFAVTISIWLHNLSEKRHQRAEAREFLAGLKTDLKNDIAEMQQDTASYGQLSKFFIYLVDNRKQALDTGYIQNNSFRFWNTTGLIPNISRFEALKYSGKIGFIENKELLDEILNLYQEQIPHLIANTNLLTNFKTGTFGNYLDNKLIGKAIAENNLGSILVNDEIFISYLLRIINIIPSVQIAYAEVLKLNEKLIGMIDKELE